MILIAKIILINIYYRIGSIDKITEEYEKVFQEFDLKIIEKYPNLNYQFMNECCYCFHFNNKKYQVPKNITKDKLKNDFSNNQNEKRSYPFEFLLFTIENYS